MGLYDRDYTQPESRRQHYNLSQGVRFSLPQMTPAVKGLLIINVAVFVVSLFPPMGNFLVRWGAVNPMSWATTLQPWRVITYQFLHSRYDLLHIVFNMFGLFFFGPLLERFWGSRRFLAFYLLCGASGGLLYPLLAHIGFLNPGPMVGASGAIMGLIIACAILFPQLTVIFFIFPMPIRVLAAVFAIMSFLTVIRQGANAGGEAAHLAGLVVGAAFVVLQPRYDRLILRMRSGLWEKRVEESRRLQVEVDRILAKVHRSGLHSLTRGEKACLKRATREGLRRHQL
ncbi:MAG: rhomboid family intramembrane serine protease [Planctomycetes bacterium]|nr:rhomboid family intramembrane serine protease [Planctomycetota bacterium]